MNQEQIRQWLEQRPFRPLTVRLSNGVSYEVRHPENAILTNNQLVIVYPDTDKVALCALPHITCIEASQPAEVKSTR